MAKIRTRDVVVILPGIAGSVLQKDGKDLWAISGQSLFEALKNRSLSLQELRLAGDDSQADNLEDGITATRLMPNAHYVPGVCWIDGYSDLGKLISDSFLIAGGDIKDPKPANFFSFPYDWRRDNRVAARALKRLIDRQLPKWREYSGATNAKVILLAHSMGGLIARYYLEVLEGWRDCKALFSFGTPYRGSVKMLDYMANGYKNLFVDLTDVMRSFTSVYQLLPIYEMLMRGGKECRVAETDNIPGVVKSKAQAGLAFHREIEAAVERHKKESKYLQTGYKIIPVVGTHQPTLQSARLSGGKLTASTDLPKKINALLRDGDGTVPYASAIPIELSGDYRESFVAETHGSLQKNRVVLEDLRARLQHMQIEGLDAIRGASVSSERASIGLDVDDLYFVKEPVEVRAKTLNFGEVGGLAAQVFSVATDQHVMTSEFTKSHEDWMLTLDKLERGLYRIEVQAHNANPNASSAVHAVFEVIS